MSDQGQAASVEGARADWRARAAARGVYCTRFRTEGKADMVKHALLVLALVLSWPTLAAAQNPVTADSPFQMRALVSLKGKDAVVVSNSGASGSALCANAYAFDAEEGQLLDCCSCHVPPNVLRSIPIAADLLENDKPLPKSLVLKLLAAAPVAGECSASAPGALVIGLTAWKGETPLTPATLSATELSAMTVQCGFAHPAARTCDACPAPPPPM
jgi:hypothetical protein